MTRLDFGVTRLVELVADLDNFRTQDCTFKKSGSMYEKGDEKAEFLTEAYLYNLLGKDDARSLLGRWDQIKEAVEYVRAEAASREQPPTGRCKTCGLEDPQYYKDLIATLKRYEGSREQPSEPPQTKEQK